MSQATALDNTFRPTNAELAQAFNGLEGAINDIRNMADLCTATIESETEPRPALGEQAGDWKKLDEQSINRMLFCAYQLEGMIKRFADGYMAARFPDRMPSHLPVHRL